VDIKTVKTIKLIQFHGVGADENFNLPILV